MLRNYLRTAFRNLGRHRGYAALNVAGLAVGLAGALLIGLYVHHEATYDRFHEKSDRLHRMTLVFGDFGEMTGVPAAAVPRVAERYPEVEAAVRVIRTPTDVRRPGGLVREERFFYADAAVLEAFTYPLRAGDAATALAEPGSVVLSAGTAARYFGDGPAVGETIELGDGKMLRVTGVAEPVPSNTHLPWELLASFSTLGLSGDPSAAMGHQGFAYLLLHPEADAAALQAKIDAVTGEGNEAVQGLFGFYVEGLGVRLQPVADVHLHSEAAAELVPTADVRTLWAFAAIAVFLVLLACVNYMNLATARSVRRAREVGVRKVLGAHRGQLVAQFLGESVLLALVALGLAVVLAELAMPLFRSLSGQALAVQPLGSPVLIALLAAAGVGVGLLAGSYPALVLSGFLPARVLKGGGGRAGGARVRQALVTFQFAVSIALLLGTAVLLRQVDYLQSKPLGYDTSGIVAVPLTKTMPVETFKAQALGVAGVRAAALGHGTPLQGWQFMHEHDGENAVVRVLTVDEDYLDTFGMTLVEGRGLDPARAADSSAVVVNETAARLFGLAVGDRLPDGQGLVHEAGEHVVGVVSDFHGTSLHEPIMPTVITAMENSHAAAFFTPMIAVRLDGGRGAAPLEALEALWAEHVSDEAFRYEFVDAMVRQQYEAETRLAGLVGAFAGLAGFVACLGLFGLAAFTAEQRTKEIGVRKVLGAETAGLVLLLTRDFLRLVALAFVLAAPLAWIFADRWLGEFAYRVELSWSLFAAVAVVVAAVAFATVGYQALRAALADPARSLRYE